MNKEIEIPEGYEARIEGNKVVLEPKESEDERIRKNIISWLKNIEGQTIPINEYNSALAWLERQKEQKPIISAEESLGISQEEYNIIVDECIYGEHKEQKFADDKTFEEWIDDLWKRHKVNNPNSYDKGDEIQFNEWGFKNFCRGIRNTYQQKPAEWSEEDKKMLNNCVNALKEGANGHAIVIDYGEHERWLKSLPKRFNLQPKKEWSEEDKEYLAACIDVIDNFYTLSGELKTLTKVNVFRREYAEKLKSWLKSLRPQPHWKPSEGQMGALKEVVDEHWEADGLHPLYTLYDALKKL